MTQSADRIPLSRPEFGADEERAVAECLRSGWVSSGPRVVEFESAFAAMAGCATGVATSSGTSALHLALWLLDLRPGDEVITPSLTWVSVPNMIAQLGARPVFCDVDPETLNIDLDDAEALVTSRTRAIVPVHFAGRPVDMTRVGAFARRHGIAVIEDAAHAIGGRQGDRPIGCHSGLVAFSFHPNKNITTGEGGMLTGLDEEKLARARLLRYHGITRETYRRTGGTELPHYDALLPAPKYIMTDIAASIGLCQLSRLPDFNARRARLAARYRAGLATLADRIWIPPDEDDPSSRHTWHLFTIRVEDRDGYRDSVMRALLDRGIGVGLHYAPVHSMSWPRERGLSRPLPNTERVGRTILSLPLFPSMTDGQVDRVIDAVQDVLDIGPSVGTDPQGRSNMQRA